jgi:hypothetical protein
VRGVALALVGVTVASAATQEFNLGLISFAVVGTVILWHRPDNRIGWLLILIAGLPSIALFAPNGTGLLGVVHSVLGQLIALCAGLTIFLVLLFPTGHLPSPRWRWPARVAGGCMAVIALLGIVRVDAGETANPTAVPALQPLVDALFAPVTLVLVAIGLAAVVHGLLRLRRAHGDEREQLRWFAFSCMLVPVLVFATAGSSFIVVGFALG